MKAKTLLGLIDEEIKKNPPFKGKISTALEIESKREAELEILIDVNKFSPKSFSKKMMDYLVVFIEGNEFKIDERDNNYKVKFHDIKDHHYNLTLSETGNEFTIYMKKKKDE